MKRLILIGNGFDMAHGLLTGFNDFVKSTPYLDEMYAQFKKGDNGWSEVEARFKELITDILNANREGIDVGKFVEDVLDSHGTNENGEVDYYDYRPDTFKQEINGVSPVVYSLRSFETGFLRYLRKKYSDAQISQCCIPIIPLQKLFANATRVISFNYTNVPELVYGYPSVEHIHGNINDKIVIGCDTFDRLSESMVVGDYPLSTYSGGRPKDFLIERERFYEYDMEGTLVEREPIKRFYDDVKFRNDRNERELYDLLKMRSKEYLPKRQEIISSLGEELYDEVYIIGHSLGESDWSVISAIRAKQIICYYHDDDDKKRKQKNIERNGWNIILQPDTLVITKEPALA